MRAVRAHMICMCSRAKRLHWNTLGLAVIAIIVANCGGAWLHGLGYTANGTPQRPGLLLVIIHVVIVNWAGLCTNDGQKVPADDQALRNNLGSLRC